MRSSTHAGVWERAAWVSLLATYVGTTLAVAKIPLAPAAKPVLERFSGSEFAALSVCTAITITLWLAALVRERRPLRFTPAHFALGCLGVVVIVAALNADVLPLAVFGEVGHYMGLVTWICCLVILFAASQLTRTRSRLRAVTRTAVILGVTEAVLGISQVLGVDIMRFQLPESSSWMLSQGIGTVGNPNQFASVLVVPFVIGCAEVMSPHASRWRTTAYFATATIGVALVASATRGAWVGAAAGIAVLGCLLLRTRVCSTRQLATGLILLALTIGAGVALADQAILSTRFPTTNNAASTAEQLSNGRLLMWQQSATVFTRHPLIGVGPDSVRNAFKASSLETGVMGLIVDDPHSMPMLVAVAFGTAGLVAATWLLVAVLAGTVSRIMRNPVRRADEALLQMHGWLAAVLALLATSLVSVSSIPMLLVLALSLGVVHAPDVVRAPVVVAPQSRGLAAVSLLHLAFFSVAIWGSLTSLYYDVRLGAVDAAIPLAAQSMETLDAADRALPWRRDIMTMHTVWMIEQAAYEHRVGLDSDSIGSGRFLQLRTRLDARVERYPADFFAWLMRARVYMAAARTLGDSRLNEEAISAIDAAARRFPRDPELSELRGML